MKKPIAVLLVGLGIMVQASAAYSYTLQGRVTGLRTQGNSSCYIAVLDKAAAGYSNAWHSVKDQGICNIAKMAFENGRVVKVDASVDPGPRNANDINSIEITWEAIKWPPYFP